MKVPTTLTILYTLFLVSCSNSQPSQTSATETPTIVSSYSWARLHAGMKVYAGDDGGATLTVCPTLVEYHALADLPGVLSQPGDVGSCTRVKRGTAAIVDKIVPGKKSELEGAPYIWLRALDSSWSGYTIILRLQPAIPAGTLLIARQGENEPPKLAPRQRSDLAVGSNLSGGVKVKVLRYDPTSDSRKLYFIVLSGDDAGQSGWTFSSDWQTEDGENADFIDWQGASP